MTYFDRHASELRRDRLVDKAVAVMPLFDGLAAGAHIVEAGAGTGLYTLPLAQAGFRVTAVDLSAASLDELKKAAEAAGIADRIDVVVGDIRDVVPIDADCVSFLKVLHHFESADAIGETLRAAWSGVDRLVIFAPNGANPLWSARFRMQGREIAQAERNIRLIRARFFDEMLHALPGARVMRTYRYLIPGTIAVQSATLGRIDRALTRIPGLRAVALNLAYRVDRAV